MDQAQKFLKDRKAARERMLAARKAFMIARNASASAAKEYAKYVIPRAPRAPKKTVSGKKGRRG